MKRGVLNPCKQGKLDYLKGPIKILGISCSNRAENDCARENPISLELLKITLKEAKKNGAQIELINLKDLTIGPCKECYSSCPAQCRFHEKLNMCDCYPRKNPTIILDNGDQFSLQDAYERLNKEDFLKNIKDKHHFDSGDDMHIVYNAMREADGIIFAGFSCYYSRPPLMQAMFSRLAALDGGVEKLWGDGKNLKNSINYSKNPKNQYNQRLYGKQVAFINSSKEGDSVSPDLMKACSMMGMKIIPFSTCSRVNGYTEPTHRVDMKNSLKDEYILSLTKFIGKKIVEESKKSDRKYGIYSPVV
jgi:multimeric flavodoxin WrbA